MKNLRFEKFTAKSGHKMVSADWPDYTLSIHYSEKSVSIYLTHYAGGHESVNIGNVPNNRQAKRDAIARLIKALEILEGK
jgi:hypothetical protein